MVIISGVYFFLKYRIYPRNPYKRIIEHNINIIDAQSLIRTRIYYPDADTGKIELKAAWLPRVMDSNDKISIVVAEYIKISGISDTAVRRVFYSERTGILYLDFSSIHLNRQGGAVEEYIFLKGLFQTLDTNFPFITGVQLMLNGEYENTLNGHISINDPIITDRFLMNGE